MRERVGEIKLSPHALGTHENVLACTEFYAHKSFSWSHPEDPPYLVPLRPPGPLSVPTAPGGNTPALRGSGEGAHLRPAPGARPQAGRAVAGGRMRGGPTPWPRALVCRQLGTGARPCGGSAGPAPWVLRSLSARESYPCGGARGHSQVVRSAGALRAQRTRHSPATAPGSPRPPCRPALRCPSPAAAIEVHESENFASEVGRGRQGPRR